MFDIGFAELLIIGVVALIVIGPERLPEAVRTGSAWLNRLRRGFNDIKQEVQQELHNDAVMRDLRESGQKLQQETQRLRRELDGSLTGDDPAAKPPAADTTQTATPGQPDQPDGKVAGTETDVNSTVETPVDAGTGGGTDATPKADGAGNAGSGESTTPGNGDSSETRRG